MKSGDILLTGTTYTYGQLCKKFNETPISRKGLTTSEYKNLKEKHITAISQKIGKSIESIQYSKDIHYYINYKPEPKRLQQQRLTREKKLARGSIITIPANPTYSILEPIEFDLSYNPYSKTDIESYILYLLLNIDHYYLKHLSEFYTLTLHSSKLYSELLLSSSYKGVSYLLNSNYPSIVIEEGFNIILDRLQSKIYDIIEKYKKQQIISINTHYPIIYQDPKTGQDKHSFLEIDTVDYYGDLAKKELGYYVLDKNCRFEKSTGHDGKISYLLSNSYIYKKGNWKIFNTKRQELIQVSNPQYEHLRIKSKEWVASANIDKHHPKYIKLTPKEQQRILFLFFEIFRIKFKHDIDHNKISLKDIDLKNKGSLSIGNNFLKDVYNCYERFLYFDPTNFNSNPISFQIDTFGGSTVDTNFSWNGTYKLNRIEEIIRILDSNEEFLTMKKNGT